MTDNVIPLGCITYLDLPPDRILEAAKGKLDSVLIIGFDKDGGEYFCSSIADGGEAIWHLERAKLALLRLGDGDSND